MLEDRIDADLVLGRNGVLVGELRELVAQYPLRERLRAQLMAALYRAGRQAEALEVFREGRVASGTSSGSSPALLSVSSSGRSCSTTRRSARPLRPLCEPARGSDVVECCCSSHSSPLPGPWPQRSHSRREEAPPGLRR